MAVVWKQGKQILGLLCGSLPIRRRVQNNARFARDLKDRRRIGDEAAELLKAAGTDQTGTIMKIELLSGRYIQAGGKKFGTENAREIAKWENALKELVSLDLVVERGYKGQVFELTHRGWSVAEELLTDIGLRLSDQI